MDRRYYIKHGTAPSRYLCDVLDEIKTCYKTRNFTPVEGLVEEARIIGRRMEAALSDQHTLEGMRRALKEAKQELTQLDKEIQAKSELIKEIK